MSSRREISPRVARRRALLVDLLCGALLAILAMTIAAGIGVVAIGALIALLFALAWIGLEGGFARVRRR